MTVSRGVPPPLGLRGFDPRRGRRVEGRLPVVPGRNALVLETADPWEFVTLFRELRANPAWDRALRRAGRATVEHYAWSHIVRRLLLPRLHLVTEHVEEGAR